MRKAAEDEQISLTSYNNIIIILVFNMYMHVLYIYIFLNFYVFTVNRLMLNARQQLHKSTFLVCKNQGNKAGPDLVPSFTVRLCFVSEGLWMFCTALWLMVPHLPTQLSSSCMLISNVMLSP